MREHVVSTNIVSGVVCLLTFTVAHPTVESNPRLLNRLSGYHDSTSHGLDNTATGLVMDTNNKPTESYS